MTSSTSDLSSSHRPCRQLQGDWSGRRNLWIARTHGSPVTTRGWDGWKILGRTLASESPPTRSTQSFLGPAAPARGLQAGGLGAAPGPGPGRPAEATMRYPSPWRCAHVWPFCVARRGRDGAVLADRPPELARLDRAELQRRADHRGTDAVPGRGRGARADPARVATGRVPRLRPLRETQDRLWRRETRIHDLAKKYPAGTSPNSIRCERSPTPGLRPSFTRTTKRQARSSTRPRTCSPRPPPPASPKPSPATTVLPIYSTPGPPASRPPLPDDFAQEILRQTATESLGDALRKLLLSAMPG